MFHLMVFYRVGSYFSGACHKKVRYKQYKMSIAGMCWDLSHPSLGHCGNGRTLKGRSVLAGSSLQRFLSKNS